MLNPLSVALFVLSMVLFLPACGSESTDATAEETSENTTNIPQETGDDTAAIPSEDPTPSITSCDAVAGDCPSPISLRVGDVLTVFFDYEVEGEAANQFSATGTAPQVGLSPVMVGAQGAGDRASINVTAYAVGEATVDIVIWYGENEEIERNYNLLVSIQES